MAYNILRLASAASLHLVEFRPRVDPARQRTMAAWTHPIKHDVWTFDYCGFEEFWCRVRLKPGWTEPFRRPPGTWHLYAPRVEYRERLDRPELHRENMWLQFSVERGDPFFKEGLFASFRDMEEIVAPRVRLMYAIQQRGEPGGALVAHGLFLSILGEILAASRRGGDGSFARPYFLRGPETAAARRGESLLEQVDAAVSKRLQQPPGLDDLAAALNVSVSTLAHRFRAETGMTVVDRIRWLRIREARGLLGKPGASVKSVAQTLGFSSPFYFSKVFKEVSGISPLGYLKRQTGR